MRLLITRQLRQRGFTLLEVMVALTITGLALGGLFGVVSGNKRLAWQSEAALQEVSRARVLINLAQLNNERGELNFEFDNEKFELVLGANLKPPERKTQASQFVLREYEVLEENGDVVVQGSHWVELDFPE